MRACTMSSVSVSVCACVHARQAALLGEWEDLKERDESSKLIAASASSSDDTEGEQLQPMRTTR